MRERACLTYYQKRRDMILNRAKDYYENDKERLKRQAREARDKYRNLSDEEKNKKRECGKSRHHNMSEEKKTKTKRISKNLSRGEKVAI